MLDPTPVANGLARRQAEDVIVLLAAMGIAAVSDRDDDGTWEVEVDASDADAASRLIAEEYPHGFAFPSVEEAAAAERALRRRPALPPARLWLHKDTWAVAVALAACVAWFIHMHADARPLTRARLLDLGAISWDQVWVGEWWRLASAIFVHFDGAHLLTNMITLLLVGPPLAGLLGPWRFLLIFFLTGVAGNVASHVLAPTGGLKAGASGAIAGVLGALGGTGLDPGWGGRYARWQVLGALVAIYALLVGAGPQSDHVAHLGGLVAGIVLGRVLTPTAPASPRA